MPLAHVAVPDVSALCVAKRPGPALVSVSTSNPVSNARLHRYGKHHKHICQKASIKLCKSPGESLAKTLATALQSDSNTYVRDVVYEPTTSQTKDYVTLVGCLATKPKLGKLEFYRVKTAKRDVSLTVCCAAAGVQLCMYGRGVQLCMYGGGFVASLWLVMLKQYVYVHTCCIVG
jgi:hypothetical protein